MSFERSREDLVAALSADLKPVRFVGAGKVLAGLALLAAAELALYLLLGQGRPDMAAATAFPSFWWKLLAPAALAVAAAFVAVRSLDPTRSPRPGVLRLGALAAAAVAAAVVLVALWHGSDDLAQRLMWHHGLACVASMIVLSVPPVVAFGWLLRRGAPTDRRGSAIAAGAAAGAWGSFIFAFNCPHDDPLYDLVWFVVGIALVAVVARLILPALSRW